MPAPAIVAAGIGAGASLLGTGASAWHTGRQNKKSRAWSEKMYNRQYQDNLAFWRMQNAYNDPANQMARLKAAGLNPALMYGGSSSGAAGQAGAIQTPDVQQAQFRSPSFAGIDVAGSYLGQMYDFDIKQAQVNNLEAQNLQILAQASLATAQTDRSKYDLAFETEMKDTYQEAKREALRKMYQDRQVQLKDYELRQINTKMGVMKGFEEIFRSRVARQKDVLDMTKLDAQIAGIKADNILKHLDIELRRGGINPNDPMLFRVIGRLLNRYMERMEKEPQTREKSFWEKILGF